MANETTITIIGNLVNEPELRFVPSGSAVANFTIASTPQTFDKTQQKYVDGETLFLRASVWRGMAENVAESLTKGMRVVASGRLKSRQYETNGEKRTAMELEIDEIGPSLRYANAKVNRTQRNSTSGGFSGQQPARTQPPTQQHPDNTGGNGYSQADDPWATPAVANAGGWGNGPESEPPF